MTAGRVRALSLSVSTALAAACGGASDEVMRPSVPVASATPVPTSGPSASAGAPQPAAPIVMKPPIATAMKSDLEALGLDPSHLPPLAKLEPRTLRKVMPLFAKSLGVKCSGCHAEDMAAPTPHKKVAEKMWNELVGKLTASDGSALFCDSCHQGRIIQLDRRDLPALGEWMDAHFVKELRRRDGRESSCAMCHGEPRDDRFLDKWER